MGSVYETYGAQDRQTLIDCLNQGLELAHERRLGLGWLVDAAYGFTADHVWEGTLRPRVPGVAGDRDVPPTTAGQALALALVAVVERQHTHRRVTQSVLRRCLDADLLSGDAYDLVAYFHAECARDLGRLTESESELRALAAGGGKIADTAMKGLIHLRRRAGRFRALQQDLESLPATPVRSRLAGDLWWTQACFDRADECYLAARDLARSRGAAGESALSEACRAFAAGFGSPAHAARTVESARELLTAVDITWAELQVTLAALLMDAGKANAGADDEIHARCDEVAAKSRSAGLSSSAAYAELARAFHAAVRRDQEAMSVARGNLAAQVDSGQFGYLLEIIDFWLPERAPHGQAGPVSDWIDSARNTAGRWRDVVERRRALLAGPHP
ncbi:hypothetical protein AB0G73_02310 [Streptomyces sp. NPDC020719]|uniref:hypothetical protein n=1 Tax=unclassified Streptomyces TaxID=2593676 RepID=UPI0033C2C11E